MVTILALCVVPFCIVPCFSGEKYNFLKEFDLLSMNIGN